MASFLSKGHHSPSEVIEGLSSQMKAVGPSAKLLVSQGYERQSLGNWKAALADFAAAIDLEPNYYPAYNGCSQTLLYLERYEEAEVVARSGLALRQNATEQGPFYALLARALEGQHRWTDALDSWRAALHSHQPEIDWFLGEANALDHLSLPVEKAESLALACQRNPSAALRRAWIHALVDSGAYESASREIDIEIAKSRWQSSWLLLRARIHGAEGRAQEQHSDAFKAWNEIRERLNPSRPDPQLAKEATNALMLLGYETKANELP